MALLDRGSLWKVSSDVTALFPVVENDFKIVAIVASYQNRL